MSGKEEKDNNTGLEIAVIGMAGRFPGARHIHEFWENLKNGVETISFFSDRELEEIGMDASLWQDPSFVRARGVLADVEYFEPGFFNFTPREAEIMDPQLRIFLECSWHALEDAGYDPYNYDGSIGVYAGNANNHYWIAKTMFSEKNRYFGIFKSSLLNTHFSTRVSYHLNLKGPSFTINTACSTSLTAIHVACLALVSGECDMALAGGVSLSLPQEGGYFYQEGMIGSPDGHCRTFDALAKGTVSGSGAGVVLLKRMEEARGDHDNIYALVKGTALNNDGLRKIGYTAPSVEGQAEAIYAAYLMAEVKPETISYIETHGTGTQLGDPVEIEALNMVFKNSKKKSIPIGSVKTNLGHLDAAAGVTGFIKTVLALKHQMIPPSLHFNTPNPKIDFENSPFYVNTGLQTRENNRGPLRAGVSSFGLGGTNAHVVLEEAPVEIRDKEGTRELAPLYNKENSKKYQLILLSAKTPTALEKQTGNVVEFLKKNPGIQLADAIYTLQVGRKPFQYRRMAICPTNNPDQVVGMLSKNNKKVKTSYSKVENPPVIFLLAGQGSQYVNMGRELYENEPVFQQEILRCFEILITLTGYDIKEILYPGDSVSKESSPGYYRSDKSNMSYNSYMSNINQTDITQPLVFSFEYALAKLLMHRGIKPRAMIGYSLGEYIAACLSGVFSLEDALKVVALRGKLMQKTPTATMLSVPLPGKEIKTLLANHPDHHGVWLAIDNGPTCIVTGAAPAVQAFEKQMKDKKLICAAVNLSHAVHSPMMEPIRREFVRQIKEIKFNKPRVPYISNVSANWLTGEQAADPGYWGTHMCSMVRFSEGIKELLKEDGAVFIEIGPGRVLSNIVRQHAPPGKKNPPGIVNVIKHQQEKAADDYFLLKKIGELWLYGVKIDWNGFYAEEKRSRVTLPAYPFERQRYWLDEHPGQQALTFPFPPGQARPAEAVEAADKPGNNQEYEQEPLTEMPGVPGDEEEYAAPRDELEQDIARVWREFLGFKRISIHANFFDINGDSLTATQLVTRLQHIYQVEISLRQFFEKPTILHLAEMIQTLLIEKVKNLSEEELDKLAGTA